MQCLPEDIQTCSAVSVPSLGGPSGRRQGVSPSGIRLRSLSLAHRDTYAGQMPGPGDQAARPGLAPRRRFVPLERLVAQLQADPTTMPRLVLISAPAGFGKTTLLTQWLAAGRAGDPGVADHPAVLDHGAVELQSMARG